MAKSLLGDAIVATLVVLAALFAVTLCLSVIGFIRGEKPDRTK